jgi:EAL domain-containing protein (putative c-di-GMP-specific phosphodiesterase class I)
VYDAEVDTNSPRRLALATDLTRGIESGELVVHYQPKARLADGVVVGVEALVRWEHPIHGFVSPDEFVPLAETTGVIRTLTAFVLRRAIRDCARWQSDGYDLHVAVNLAARSLHDASLAAEVAALLSEFDLEPSHLTLEITESSVMSDMSRSTRVLDDLAAIGVHLSVDDFGTGYSSLAYLQQLPVREIKIDKSFVFALTNRAEDATIVRSVVDLGHNLGLRVVAEGVEHGAVWEHLAAIGCDVAQGYYLSRPMAEPQLRDYLAAQRARHVAFERV